MSKRGLKKSYMLPSDAFERIMLSLAKSEQKYMSIEIADQYMLERNKLVTSILHTWDRDKIRSLWTMAFNALYELNKLVELIDRRI